VGRFSDDWKKRHESPERPRPAEPPETASEWHDPREDESWFQELDPVTQGQLRVDWITDHRMKEKRALIRVQSRRRGWREGVAVFVLANTVFAPFALSWSRTLAAAVVGAAVGALWYRIRAGRFQAMATGLPAQVMIQAAFSGSSIEMIFSLFTTLAFAALACIVGTGREFRRLDGSEA